MNLDDQAAESNPIPSITRREWILVGGMYMLVMILTALPYLWGYFSSSPDKQFMGIMIDVPDHVQYFSWMRELSEQFLASNKLTPEPNAPLFFNLLWWVLGQFSRIFGWNYHVMFQLLRFAAAAGFMTITYYLCAWFFRDVFRRMLSFSLILFSAGFGWVIIAAKYLFDWTDIPLPTQLLVYIMEPNTFFSILAVPHLVVAAWYVLVFALIMAGEARNQLRYAVFAGLFALFIGLQHAYDLFLIYGILGTYGLFKTLRDRKIPMFLLYSGIILVVISVWPGLYSALLTTLDPIWDSVLAQYANAGVFTPQLWVIWVLMGPTFLVAIYTVLKIRFWKFGGKDDRVLFLIAWFWANFVLLYIPTDFQIKMLNGWQIPVSLLAVWGFSEYILPAISRIAEARKWTIRNEHLAAGLAIAFVLGSALTNVYLWSWRFLDLARHDYPYYLTRDEVGALSCLDAVGERDDVVLSSLMIGQYVPPLTGKSAFIAHWAQTVDYYNKEAWSKEFFGTTATNTWRQQVIEKYSIDYIFYGPVEQELGEFNPANLSIPAQEICRLGSVVVYEIR